MVVLPSVQRFLSRHAGQRKKSKLEPSQWQKHSCLTCLANKQDKERLCALFARDQGSGITQGVMIPAQRWQPRSFPLERFHICKAKNFAERVLTFLRRRARRIEDLAPQRLHARSRERSNLPKSAQSLSSKRTLTRCIKPDSARSA